MKRAALLVQDENEKLENEKKIKKNQKGDLKNIIEEKENFQITLKENVVRCTEEKLKILLKDERVIDYYGRLHKSSINSRKLIGNFSSRIQHFFPKELFVLINSIINKNLLRKYTTILLKSSKKHFASSLKLSETPKFLSLCWEIEYITSNKNSSLREVYKELKKREEETSLWNEQVFRSKRLF